MDVKVVAVIGLVFVLLVGCISEKEKEPTQVEKKYKEIEETLSTLEREQKPSIIKTEQLTYKALSTPNGPVFPMTEFNQAPFKDIGIHSKAFIVIDSNVSDLLDKNEKIFLTPFVEKNKGVIFNAVYEQKMENCNTKAVILGKEYELTDLKQNLGLEGDDKWIVHMQKNNGCVSSIVISLNGYFYDLKEGEKVVLFSNGVKAWFLGLNSNKPDFVVELERATN